MGTEKEARVDVETEINDEGVYQEKMTAKEWIADKWHRNKKKIILVGALALGALGFVALAHKDDDDDAVDLLATGFDDDNDNPPESIETTETVEATETTETETEAA